MASTGTVETGRGEAGAGDPPVLGRYGRTPSSDSRLVTRCSPVLDRGEEDWEGEVLELVMRFSVTASWGRE